MDNCQYNQIHNQDNIYYWKSTKMTDSDSACLLEMKVCNILVVNNYFLLQEHDGIMTRMLEAKFLMVARDPENKV